MVLYLPKVEKLIVGYTISPSGHERRVMTATTMEDVKYYVNLRYECSIWREPNGPLSPKEEQMDYTQFFLDLEKTVKDKSFEAVFVKKDGNFRIMTCKLSDEVKMRKLHLGLLVVHDIIANGFRTINIDTLIALSINGRIIKEKDNRWPILET